MTGATRQAEDEVMTVEEFRRWPGDGTGRVFDLVNGRPRAQSSPSQTHGTVQNNLQTALTVHLRGLGLDCRPVPTPSIVPSVLSTWNERHPDIGVTCEPNDPDIHEVRKPVAVIEILSKTNAEDTWDNVALYTTLPSVREILVLESEAVYGYLYMRLPDGTWPPDYTELGPDDTVRFPSIDWEISMSEIYHQTNLDSTRRPKRGRRSGQPR
jgi:Uma2 family endonuclease